MDENDKQLIEKLADINIVCGKSQAGFLKSKTQKQTVIKCDELDNHVWNIAKVHVETTGTQITPLAAQLAAAAQAEAENNAAAA